MPVPLDGPCEEPAPVILRGNGNTPQRIRERDFIRIIVEPDAVATLEISDRAVILDGGTAVSGGTAGERPGNGTPRREYPAIRAGGRSRRTGPESPGRRGTDDDRNAK